MIKAEITKERNKNFLQSEVEFYPLLKFLFFIFLVSGFVACSAVTGFAQEEVPDDDATAPPPLIFISNQEKSALASETNVKKHTVLALGLMDARILKAETYNTQKQYRQMYGELGGFHALVDDTLDYLNKHDTDSGKVLSNFKRLEMSLRKFAPRLELIRRELPFKYESFVRVLIKFVRQARSKAVEPLFDDSVVKDSVSEKP